MQARHFKLVLLVSILIVVWQLGRSDVVLNALFLFAAVGAVPGTNITLEPNAVFWVLGVLLGFAVLLIFATNLRRGIAALFRPRKATTAEPIETVEESAGVAEALAIASLVKPAKARAAKAAKPKVVLVIKPVRRPSKLLLFLRALARAGRRQAAITFAAARRHFPRMVAAASAVWLKVRYAARQIAGVVWRAAGIAGNYVARYAGIGGRLLRGQLIRAAIITGRAAVRAWDWLEPHLQLFDYWLGVQYHTALDALKRHETTKSVAHMLKEANKVIASGRAEVREALTRVVEK